MFALIFIPQVSSAIQECFEQAFRHPIDGLIGALIFMAVYSIFHPRR